MLKDLRLRLLDLYNRLDYPLRQAFRWQRGELHTANESKDALFHDLPAEQRLTVELEAQRLLRAYNLDWLFAHSRAENYRENLYYLAMLESAFSQSAISLKDELVCADIGVSSWFYVQALYNFLRWYRTPHHRSVDLYGYECDAYRVYSDLHSRYDHALTHIGGLKNVHYVPQAFTSQPERFDIILMLFPFMFLKDHLEWGLPSTQFSPQRLLEEIKVSLKGDGILIIVNQGIAEHERQSVLLEQVEMPIKLAFRFDSPLYAYEVDRYVIITSRTA